MPPLTLRALLPTGKYGASHSLGRVCVYSPCLSFGLTRLRAYTSAASAAACAASRRCLRAAYSGSVSQWAVSPFKAASSPITAERSRAVSLATSFGSCGSTYAFLGFVAEASIHASYGHPTVLTDLIIASPAAMPRDGTHLSKSLERIVHRVVR